MQKEVDECQVGIKKLAESVTTVKNVLERKVNEEARTVSFTIFLAKFENIVTVRLFI